MCTGCLQKCRKQICQVQRQWKKKKKEKKVQNVKYLQKCEIIHKYIICQNDIYFSLSKRKKYGTILPATLYQRFIRILTERKKEKKYILFGAPCINVLSENICQDLSCRLSCTNDFDVEKINNYICGCIKRKKTIVCVCVYIYTHIHTK